MSEKSNDQIDREPSGRRRRGRPGVGPGRPPLTVDGVLLGVRIDKVDSDGIDRYAARHDCTRAQAVRMLLKAAIAHCK